MKPVSRGHLRCYATHIRGHQQAAVRVHCFHRGEQKDPDEVFCS
uniref:Uncharacterized protein n=1 Tax=Anguilla anguilla TaxID=7936 RepID=A0A0E9VR16_ANGAN